MKLMVIDGNSLINRAFYGVRPLSTRDGTPTNAVYGFLTILQRLLDEEKPDALCVCFDRREPTFRHLQYEPYKAQRKGMPEELAVQMPILKDVLDAMNIPRYELAGWEADDLIGTIAALDTQKNWETVVVTGDKDSLQLVTDTARVKLISSRMGQTTTRDVTPAAFFEEYGFTPEKIVDLKGLMGDASDNIPGVAGIGEKTAMELVSKHGTILEIYEKLNTLELKPAALRKLTEGRAQADLSFDLATIRCDAPLEFSPEENLRGAVNAPALYELFLKLEFSKLIEKFGLQAAQTVGSTAGVASFSAECTSEVVTGCARVEALLSQWRGADFVAVVALPSLDGAAVCCGGHVALLLQSQLEGYNDALRELFSPEVRKVAHNVKDLMNALLSEGLSAEGFLFDTEIAAYLLAPTDGSYALEKLGLTYFNCNFASAADYTNSDAFSPLADPAPARSALVAHASLVAALYGALAPKIEELGMHELYYGIELPLCRVLAEMERKGILVERKALSDFGVVLRTRIAELETEIYQLAGEPFNIASPKQLGVILFEKLNLPPTKKTKTGYSTNVEVLETLRGQHAIIDVLMEYRQLTKLSSTYVDGLTKVMGPDGRVHTSFQNTVTATGRLSSTEPNLQNIPVRTKLGAQLREMFVAGEGAQLVDADYSQIELRLLAHIANDKTMQAAFSGGTDIHTVTASEVFATPIPEVTGEQRRRAKAVNFGIVYGISDFSLSQDIGVARWEAKEYIEKYLATFSGVRDYMLNVVEEARRDGFVTTLFGRRRWLPELKSANFNLRSFGERVALNMPIQGTAADVMKLAMVRVAARIRAENLAARLVLQVHDELIVECPDAEVERVKTLLTEEMQGAAQLSVTLTAVSHAGRSWAEAKD